MVRNLILGLFCLVLAGCAASPPSSVLMSEATTQKRQAVQADPLTEEQQAVMNKARRAMNEERWEAAIESLESLERQRPEVAEIHASLAWIARQQGKPEQAMAAYRTAFDLDPGDAVSANNLALLDRKSVV